MDIPDFTRGAWKTPCRSNLMDATIDLSKIEVVSVEKARDRLNA